MIRFYTYTKLSSHNFNNNKKKRCYLELISDLYTYNRFSIHVYRYNYRYD